ncbi:SagB/ThcOx family dehydrogenase [Pyrobaculum sp.]|uniref:SagB/ThcOx family dehydrogenase n=1 Tax=Pyrobaculum sp. TaxID=2004705 RepID=UPI003D12E316
MEELEFVIKIDEELETKEDPLVIEKPPRGLRLYKDYKELLPLPRPDGPSTPFLEVVKKRRSGRLFAPRPISLQELSNILFAAAGVTETADGIYGMLDYPLRSSPSAGGLHCVDLYLAAFNVEGLEPGVYYYHYVRHSLGVLCRPCYPHTLSESFVQGEFKNAPIAMFLVGDLSRGLWKYGRAYYKYCLVDAGVVAENIHLAATAQGLSSTIIAGFDRKAVAKSLGLARHERPIVAVAVGHGLRN